MEMIRIWQKIVGSKVLPEVIHEHMPMDPTKPLGHRGRRARRVLHRDPGRHAARRPAGVVADSARLVRAQLQGHPSGSAVRDHGRGGHRRHVAAHDLAPAAREVRRRDDGDRHSATRACGCVVVGIPGACRDRRARTSDAGTHRTGDRPRLGAARPELRAGRHEHLRDEVRGSARTCASSTTPISAAT